MYKTLTFPCTCYNVQTEDKLHDIFNLTYEVISLAT